MRRQPTIASCRRFLNLEAARRQDLDPWLFLVVDLEEAEAV